MSEIRTTVETSKRRNIETSKGQDFDDSTFRRFSNDHRHRMQVGHAAFRPVMRGVLARGPMRDLRASIDALDLDHDMMPPQQLSAIY